MRRNEAIFNWLQIEIVREARPSDRSAKDTALFFEEMLREDHQVVSICKKRVGDVYHVDFQVEGQELETLQFPREVAEKLLQDILSEPKYNQSYE